MVATDVTYAETFVSRIVRAMWGAAALVVLLGAVLVLNPSLLVRQVHLGTAPSWKNFLIAIPVGISAVSPGASVICASIIARRSIPAEPAVA